MRFRWSLLVFFAYSAGAQIIPGQYVVELGTAPMGTPAKGGSAALEAAGRRANIHAEQARVQTLVESTGGRVRSHLDNVMTALVVDIADENADGLKAIPGVTRVFPVTMMHMNLDHALPLHHVPQAWAIAGGMGKAGLGMKIAVLDTGITPGHPAFQDPTLKPPAGYPIVSGPENKDVVNNKIIVARTYSALYQLKTPDSAVDTVGHGTETADCAAGMPAAGPYATVTGVAPKAFLGIYKISSPGTGSASSAVISQAIDDAVGDGMDVINLSFGSPLEQFNSLQDYVIQQTARLGTIVVTSAGNSGPVPNSVGDAADADSAITVGASQNDRELGGVVTASGVAPIDASPGGYGTPNPPVTAPLADISAVDAVNRGCKPLPADTLTGAIALAQTAGCTFETVLNEAQAAGAVAVIFYRGTSGAPRLTGWTPLGAKLPGVFVSNADGVALKNAIAAGAITATVKFEGIPIANEWRGLASFSSRGPTNFFSMKPDLAATGTFVYMATQTADPMGELYRSDGYIEENGTSFSSPIVAGAAAVLKAARPGLTVDQYRSLLINGSTPQGLPDGSYQRLQSSGAGTLALDRAILSSVAVYPTSLSFGTGGSTVDGFYLLNVTNVGKAAETFTVSSIPYDTTPAPSFATDGSNIYGGAPGSASLTITLGPGQSKVVDVNWVADGLTTGEYQGYVTVRGGTTGSTAVVPYWYGVPDGRPAYLTYLGAPAEAPAGTNVLLYFQVTDSVGVAVQDARSLNVISSVVSGGGKITGPIRSVSFPGYNYMAVTLGATPGPNAFQLKIGPFPAISVNITGVTPTPPGGTSDPTTVTSLFDIGPATAMHLRAAVEQ
ncbi:MAG: peptidase and in, kexin, sedolisin [Bryobacterales bacterium]|nr:peptidase and in, kexin, sedolisin [Bryobacterales bacterium]